MVWGQIKQFFKGPTNRSPNIPDPDYDRLEATSNFTKSELQQLFERFCHIANKLKGKVEVRSFLLQPEVIHCGLASFALAYVLEKAGKPVVDFPVFVDVLSRFSAKASRHEKVEFLFDLVKSDHAPVVSVQRFRALLLAMSKGTMSDRSLHYICNKLPDTVDVHRLNAILHDHDMLQYLSTAFM